MLLACTFEVVFGDIPDTVSRTDLDECSVKLAICEDRRKRSGAPERLIKKSCELAPVDQCSIQPRKAASGEICTQGGPLTFYYDKAAKSCHEFQNLGSCHPTGPFGSKADCDAAVAAGKCK